MNHQQAILEARERAITMGLSPDTLKTFSQGWIRPTGDDVRIIMQLAGFTESQAAQCAGVDQRSVRRWKVAEPAATYGAWCLLVHAAGLGFIPQDGATPDQ